MEKLKSIQGCSTILLVLSALGLTACESSGGTTFGQGNGSLHNGDAAADDDGGACIPDAPPTLTASATKLWPPNHKLHAIAVSDCVSAVDACGHAIEGEFIWGSSDEPVDDLGDGHFAPDILFGDCQHVSVRAERQGPKEGRVYKLGVRVVDSAGHAAEGECTVIVDHDQRGVTAQDSGEAYRIALDGTNGALSCDGVPDANADAGAPADDDAGASEPGDAGGAPTADAGAPEPPATPIADAGAPF